MTNYEQRLDLFSQRNTLDSEISKLKAAAEVSSLENTEIREQLWEHISNLEEQLIDIEHETFQWHLAANAELIADRLFRAQVVS